MIGAIIGTVVGVISTVAKSLAVAGLAISGLKAIVGVLVNIAKALGLVEEPKPEVAEKALQAEEEGITPEKFDTYDEYMNAIDKFEIDPEKKHSEEELLQKQAEILSGYILEKSPDMPIETMANAVSANPGYLTPERMTEIGKLIGNDSTKAESVFGLLNGTEKNTERIGNAEELLIQAEQALNPGMSANDALIRVYNNRT